MAEKKAVIEKEESKAEKEMRILTARKTVTLSAGDVEILPYSWADTFRLAKPFSIVFGALAQHLPELQNALVQMNGKNALGQAQAVATFLGAIEESEEVIDALADMAALAVHSAKDDVKALMWDDFITIALAVYEVNKDFFVLRLEPMLQKAKAKPEK